MSKVVRAVVTRPDGSPIQGAEVEFVSTETKKRIGDVMTSDHGGQVEGSVTGPFFVRARVTGDRTRILVTMLGAAPCYDYVVDPEGFGTHETLAGTDGAWAAADAAGGEKSIWMCDSETLSDSLSLSGMSGGDKVIIAGPGSTPGGARIRLAAPAGKDMFTGNPANLSDVMLINVELGVDSGFALFAKSLGNSTLRATMRDCHFEMSGAAITTNRIHVNANASTWIIERCTGTIKSFYQYNNNSGNGQEGDVYVRNSQITCQVLWEWDSGAFGFKTTPDFFHITNCDITQTATQVMNNFEGWLLVADSQIFFDVATAWLSGAFHSSIIALDLHDVRIADSVAGGALLNVTGNVDNIYIMNVRGFSGVAQAGAFITLSAGATASVGNVFAPAWAIIYSGPASSGGYVGDHGNLSGLTDDDHTQYLLAAGTRIASKLQVDDANFHLDILSSKPTITFDSGDFWNFDRGTNSWVWVIATTTKLLLTADGLLGAGYLRVGSTSAPTDTTPGTVYADNILIVANNNLTTQDQFKVGYESATRPAITWDANDWMRYDRTSNAYGLIIGSAVELQVRTSQLDIAPNGIASDTDKLTVTGARAEFGYNGTVADAYVLGAAGKGVRFYVNAGATDSLRITSSGKVWLLNAGLTTQDFFGFEAGSATAPRLVLDSTDYIEYDRTNNVLGFVLGGAVNSQFSWVESFAGFAFHQGTHTATTSGARSTLQVLANTNPSANSTAEIRALTFEFRPQSNNNYTLADGQKGIFVSYRRTAGTGTDARFDAFRAAISAIGSGALTEYNAYTTNNQAKPAGVTTLRGWYSQHADWLFHQGGNAYFGAEVEIDGDLNHDGSNIGFFGVTPAARAAAYTPTNVVADRSYDANATTVEELADVLGTLIADLQAYGLLQ